MLPARPPVSSAWSLQRLLSALRSHAPLILGGALLLALLTYATLARQAPRYQAVSSLLAAPGETADSVVTTAPALPGGAVEQALHSPALVQDMVTRLRGSDLDADSVARVTDDLRRELTEQDFSRLSVQDRLNDQQGGTYIVAAQGRTPQEAKVLADTAVDALLAWDQARAVQGVSRLQRSLRSYLASLDRRLAATPDIGRRQALLQARQGASDRLAQLEQVQEAASGTLSPLASAVAPARPVSASPLPRTLLAFLLAALLGTVLAAWRAPAGARGRPAPGVPELGWLPALGANDLQLGGAAEQSTQTWPAPLRRAVTLLRSSLLEQLPVAPRRVVVTAARPTAGRPTSGLGSGALNSNTVSTVTALLARSLAEAGQRVLLIDANLHSPSQHELWGAAEPRWLLLNGASEQAPPAPTLAAALLSPQGARARNVAPGVDLLGAAQTPDSRLGLDSANLDSANLDRAQELDLLLTRWGETYDIVLIDAPSLELSGDAARLGGARLGGGRLGGARRSLLLLAEDSGDRGQALAATLADLPESGAEVLGVVWNNVPQAQTWLRTLAPRSRPPESPLRPTPAAESEGL